MTCRYSETDWRDVLYNSVRKTNGGLAAAAQFLTTRRGRSIHPESLRAKLNGHGDDTLSVEMAMMLTEWMRASNPGADHALDWLHAFNAQHGLTASAAELPDAETDDPVALLHKGLRVGEESGALMRLISHAISDLRICANDLDALVKQIRRGIRLLNKIEGLVRRLASQSKGGAR